MKTVASNRFLAHIAEIDEAIAIYNHLKSKSYDAKFNLRFVWMYGVSALDDYITQLILEKATEKFSLGEPQTARLLAETVRTQ